MNKRDRRIRLLPKEALIKTGAVDHADWNFSPFLGWIQRLRFQLIVSLLPKYRVPRLLEVGYGSGVLMPELMRHCHELYGIDIHLKQRAVTEQLQKFGVNARLYSGSAAAMPFEDGYFDCVVAVSSLEFVEDMTAAREELKRVLKPGGCIVMVTPGCSPVVDFGLKLLTGQSAKNDYGDRRQNLIPTLLESFTVEAKRSVPSFASSIVCLYTALRLRPQPNRSHDNKTEIKTTKNSKPLPTNEAFS